MQTNRKQIRRTCLPFLGGQPKVSIWIGNEEIDVFCMDFMHSTYEYIDFVQ